MRNLDAVDLRREESRRALGVELVDLTGPRSRAQALARRARELGAEGMVLPSAAFPEHWNLVVFPDGFGNVSVVGSTATHPKPPPSLRRISSG